MDKLNRFWENIIKNELRSLEQVINSESSSSIKDSVDYGLHRLIAQLNKFLDQLFNFYIKHNQDILVIPAGKTYHDIKTQIKFPLNSGHSNKELSEFLKRIKIDKQKLYSKDPLWHRWLENYFNEQFLISIRDVANQLHEVNIETKLEEGIILPEIGFRKLNVDFIAEDNYFMYGPDSIVIKNVRTSYGDGLVNYEVLVNGVKTQPIIKEMYYIDDIHIMSYIQSRMLIVKDVFDNLKTSIH